MEREAESGSDVNHTTFISEGFLYRGGKQNRSACINFKRSKDTVRLTGDFFP